MKNNKKVKIGKLNFYLIDEDYISYLSQFDFKLLEEKYLEYSRNFENKK